MIGGIRVAEERSVVPELISQSHIDLLGRNDHIPKILLEVA
jgi:hypothetical protein